MNIMRLVQVDTGFDYPKVYVQERFRTSHRWIMDRRKASILRDILERGPPYRTNSFLLDGDNALSIPLYPWELDPEYGCELIEGGLFVRVAAFTATFGQLGGTMVPFNLRAEPLDRIPLDTCPISIAMAEIANQVYIDSCESREKVWQFDPLRPDLPRRRF